MVLKGSVCESNRDDVNVLAVLDEASHGNVLVGERRLSLAGQWTYAEYVKPLSELKSELQDGSLEKIGERSVESIRETLSGE